jgi:hypothetical protein
MRRVPSKSVVVVLRQQFLGEAVTGKIFADKLLGFGGSGQHGAAIVDHQHLGTRA